MASSAVGRFVWFDLTTTDVQAAELFYKDVVGWQVSKWPAGDYDMWKADGQEVGGVMPLSAEARKVGAPPYWIGYVDTDDVDITLQKAQSFGGKIVVPGTDIPGGVGRFAILADPQGATFALYRPSREISGDSAIESNAIGRFGWAELNTTDWRAAWKFYSALFGWQHTSSVGMGEELGEYFMFGTDLKRSMGGMSNSAKMLKRSPYWLHYVNVKDADETARKVTQKGGKILGGPMDVPGGGRIAQCMDVQGGVFAIAAFSGEA